MPPVFKFSIDAELENLKSVRSFVNESGKALGADADTLGDLCLVVDEAVTNIVLHGYDGSEGVVDLELQSDGEDLVVRILDKAPAFGAEDVETPHLEEPLAHRNFGGMGVYLIRKLTDEAEFRTLPGGGNELFLRKRGVIPAER